MDICVLRGRASIGKSTTLKKVIDLIQKKYPNCKKQEYSQEGEYDKTYIFANVLGHKIGVETQGDPNSRLKESLKMFKEQNCDIIFCTCRTKGSTVDIFTKYEKCSYNVFFLLKNTTSKQHQQEQNNIIALHLLQLAGI